MNKVYILSTVMSTSQIENVFTRNNWDETPLHEAAKAGDVALCQAYLEAGAASMCWIIETAHRYFSQQRKGMCNVRNFF